VTSYAQIADQFQTGDIVLFEGVSLESRLIEDIDRSRFSHVGIAVRLPGYDAPLLWSSDTIATLKDPLADKPEAGVHLIDLRETLTFLLNETTTQKKPPYTFARRALTADRSVKFYQDLQAFMHTIDGRAFPSLAKMAEHFLEGNLGIRVSLRTFFCAELVADTYEHVGLLSNKRLVNSYSPGTFAQNHSLTLLSGASLGAEQPFSYP
jgi:hypothetical protein